MLTILGAGLSSVDDLTVGGIKALKQSDIIYLDMYTSIAPGFLEDVRQLTGKDVKLADREFVEDGEELLTKARDSNVAFIVIGDPLSATTHTDLILRAVKSNIPYRIIHNTSIMTAVGCCGLQLYNFGVTISVPFWDEFGRPDSFYDKLMWNFASGLHTLCLLDIKVKERSLENILRDRLIYEPPRFMSCGQAAYQLLEISRRRQSSTLPNLNPNCLVIGLARIGCVDQVIVVSTLDEISRGHSVEDAAIPGPPTRVTEALGGPLHTLIIPGQIHPLEEEFLTCQYDKSLKNADGMPLVFLPPYFTGDELDNVSNLFRIHNELVLRAKVEINTNSCSHTYFVVLHYADAPTDLLSLVRDIVFLADSYQLCFLKHGLRLILFESVLWGKCLRMLVFIISCPLY
ncbi:diphthine methyl ester synthase [Paragonimus westermani]|uniref:diphthine methyl ester synthase n=1 Tax=Paragonimus westermani TaxID=34504 RepID=A0A5J4N4U1_9TREM|nr:diphthine methyl ester synthase [Paragonimus westermani]